MLACKQFSEAHQKILIKKYLLDVVSSRARTGPGKPGKSWNFLWHFLGLESPGKRLLVLNSSGDLFNSSQLNMMCIS